MWTLKNGQNDDLQGAAERILLEGQEAPLLEQRYPGAEGAERTAIETNSTGQSI
jgi:nitrogen fixation-related uncharacterized protein